MGYNTPQLLRVAGLSATNFKQHINRRFIVLSGKDHPGSGNRRQHNDTDVLQAAVIVELGRVGITPRRAAMIWFTCIVPNLHRPNALILFGPREDDSDLDVRVVLPGQDDGLDLPDAPAVFAALNLSALRRRVAAKLAALESAS